MEVRTNTGIFPTKVVEEVILTYSLFSCEIDMKDDFGRVFHNLRLKSMFQESPMAHVRTENHAHGQDAYRH